MMNIISIDCGKGYVLDDAHGLQKMQSLRQIF